MNTLSTILETSISKGGQFLTKNAPTILTGLGLVGTVVTTALAITATPKVLALIEEQEALRDVEWRDRGRPDVPAEHLSKAEVIKLVWKEYVPTGLALLGTGACIVAANAVSLKKEAALVGLYAIAETGYREYREKVKEEVGEKKEERIREAISQDKLNKNPVQNSPVIVTGRGNALCFDTLTGRYFEHSIEDIRRIQNEFNQGLINERYLTLNEFYDLLGLEHTTLGNTFGWSAEYGLLEILFSSKLASDDRPCLVLDYRIGPREL